MKRSGWIACLIVGGLAGLGAAAWSRPEVERSNLEQDLAASESGECGSAAGEPCSCETGTNRAALLQRNSQEQQAGN